MIIYQHIPEIIPGDRVVLLTEIGITPAIIAYCMVVFCLYHNGRVLVYGPYSYFVHDKDNTIAGLDRPGNGALFDAYFNIEFGKNGIRNGGCIIDPFYGKVFFYPTSWPG